MRKFSSLFGISVAIVGLLLTYLWREGGKHLIPAPRDYPSTATPPSAGSVWTEDSKSSVGEWLRAVEGALISLPAGSAVIDLGCGNGLLLSRFRGRGWHLLGIDLSESGVRIARDNYPDIQFEIADATTDLEFVEYGRFDAVISTDVIEHIFLPRKYVANCFKLLRPGGILVMTTPYHGYAKNLAIALANRWDNHLQPLRDFGHIKFWSVDSLSSLLF